MPFPFGEHMPEIVDRSIWLTVSELASVKKISRASISERVLRLENQGLIKTMPGRGRTKLINIVEFDRVIGQVTDLAREQGAITRRGADDGDVEVTPSATSTYSREQAKRMAYLAEMSRLDLAERKGLLVRGDRYAEALDRTGAEMARIIDSLPQKADGVGVELGIDDAYRVRLMLKRIARELRTDLSKAFATLATEAPEFDAPIADDRLYLDDHT